MHTYDCTFLGLHKWHKHMFEHLGWMAMAKKHGNELKIKCYLDSIKRLLECLDRKKNNTKDEDRKDDLKVLIDNTNCLNECAQHLLNNSSRNSKKSVKSVKSTYTEYQHQHQEKAHDATYQGLHCWMKHKFEKLGWMCLAKKHGNTLKVECYLNSIERLMASLEKKLKELHEEDRKDDIKILYNDVCDLHSVAHKLLGSSKYSRTTSRKRTRKTSSWF